MQTQELLLQEIVMSASNTVQAGRFIADNSSAGCNGKCASGTCKVIESIDALAADFYA